MPFGTLPIVLCQINPVLGDIKGNAKRIVDAALAQPSNALCVFPELCLIGYPPEDLIYNPAMRRQVEAEIPLIAEALKDGPGVLIGAPVWIGTMNDGNKRGRDRLLPRNAAMLIAEGEIKGTVYKRDLPNYEVFDDKRVFTAGPLPEPIMYQGHSLGVVVCEDIWTNEIADHLKARGAEQLIVLNASPYERGKMQRRLDMAKTRVRETGLPLVYVNQVGGQDDLIFDGQSFVMDVHGKIALRLPVFEEACARKGHAAVMKDAEEVYKGLVLATRDYVLKNGGKGVFVGLSGGVDSALVAAIAADALGAENVRVVTMPSRFNSNESIDDAAEVADTLGLTMEMQPIEGSVKVMEEQLKLTSGIAHENIQSRLRGLMLMALSNAQPGWFVLTTTNKSELAVGYGTMYGDMAGAFAPLRDLYKKDVFALSKFRGLPKRVLTKAPSAELRDDQTDQDTLPPYDVLDAILTALIEEDADPAAIKGDPALIAKIARWVRINEFKRRQGPPGPKITARAFGRDRRYPITNAFQER